MKLSHAFLKKVYVITSGCAAAIRQGNPRIRLIFSVFVTILALIWFSTTRCWFVPDIQIFRTNTAVGVHLPTFYPPADDQAFLNFSPGNTALGLEVTDGQKLAQSAGATLYRVDQASAFCRAHANLCTGGADGNLILVTSNSGGQLATASYAVLGEYDTQLSSLRRLVATSDQPQKLFMVLNTRGKTTIRELAPSKNNTFLCNMSDAGIFAGWLLAYAVLTAFLVGALVYGITAPALRRFLTETWDASPISVAVLVIWTAGMYAITFPGIYVSDTVINRANDNSYSDWYSGLYFIITSIFRIIGYRWMQLLPVGLGLMTGLLLLRSVTLACRAAPHWVRTLASLLTVAVFIFNPAIVAAMFSQQRYLLVLAVASAGVALAFYSVVRTRLEARPPSLKYIAASLLLLVLAALLRTEYTAPLLAGVALALFNYFQERKVNPTIWRRGASSIIIVLVVFFALKEVIGRLIPTLYQYDSVNAAALYTDATAASFVYPYACSAHPNQIVVNEVEIFGDLSDLCHLGSAGGPQQFFWADIAKHGGDTDSLLKLRKVALTAIAQNWRPYVYQRAQYATETFLQTPWHVASRYALRNIARTGNAGAVSGHMALADRFGLVLNWPPIAALEQHIMRAYNQVEINLYGLALVLIASLVAILAGAWLNVAGSLTVLVMTVAVILAEPVVDWAYLAFLPVWASCLLPLTLAEVLTQRRMSRFTALWVSLINRLERFWRFAGLSGVGWLFDFTLLLVLVHSVHLPAGLANIVSSCCAALCVFLISRLIVFRGRENELSLRLVAYLLYTLVLILMASGILGALTRFFTPFAVEHCGKYHSVLVAALAKIIITPPQLLLNFLVARKLNETSLSLLD